MQNAVLFHILILTKIGLIGKKPNIISWSKETYASDTIISEHVETVELSSREGLFPIAIVTGPLDSAMLQIAVNETATYVVSVKDGINKLMNIYLATGTSYPPYARHLFTFLQRECMNIKFAKDTTTSKAYQELVNEYRLAAQIFTNTD